MLTSNRGIFAATLLAGLALSAAPASAESTDEGQSVDLSLVNFDRAAEPVLTDQVNNVAGESGFEFSGNAAVVSDYRFRGVSLSGGDFAIQGGIDLAHSSGLYLGTWGSSIDADAGYGEMELDIYGGWSGDISDGVTFDIGLIYYLYPAEDTGADTDYFEPYASVGTSLGPVSATVGVAYAWDQASLGDEDSLYLYTDFEAGIPETPLTLTAHLGYTDGVFATQADGTSFDWGLGASYAVTDSLSLGVSYVDTQGPAIEDFTDAGFFFTIGYSM